MTRDVGARLARTTSATVAQDGWLAHDAVIFSMSSNPEPQQSLWNRNCERTIMNSNAGGPVVVNPLEMDGWRGGADPPSTTQRHDPWFAALEPAIGDKNSRNRKTRNASQLRGTARLMLHPGAFGQAR